MPTCVQATEESKHAHARGCSHEKLKPTECNPTSAAGGIAETPKLVFPTISLRLRHVNTCVLCTGCVCEISVE